MGLSVQPFPVVAQNANFSIPRVADAPIIDGNIEAHEWRDAIRVNLTTETRPSENTAAPVATQALLMEDGDKVYVAFIAHDPDVEKIRAYYRDHDQNGGHDSVGVVLDTFNDRRQAFEFFVNPLGVQRDAINDDINKRYDSAWDALWESAGQINHDNYTVEMAIPFNQLRFRGSGERQTWGIDLVRLYPRDRNYRFGSNPINRNISCYLCQFQQMEGFDQLEPSVNLILTPTLTTGISESREDPANNRDWVREDDDSQASLDMRWGINQNLYLNATINPDFSQVEADNAQLDVNTTFSLFFPERRTFFLDGASYFNSQLNIVHTRNIADPDYGLKLTGKSGAGGYGVLASRDTQTSFVIPGNQGSQLASLESLESDVTIARYRHDMGENSALGIIATDRRGGEYANSVVGLDGVFQLNDSDRIRFQGLQSRSEYPLEVQEDFEQDAKLDDHAYALEYRHSDRRWDWFGRYDERGKDFRADLGFVNRVDFSKHEYGGGHTWLPDQFPYSRIRLGGNWDKTRAQDGQELEEELESFVSLNDGPRQSFIEFGGGIRERFFDGQYFDEDFKVFVTGGRPVPDIFVFFLAESAETIDFANTRLGKSRVYRAESSYQIGKHLSAGLNYAHQRFVVDDDRLFTTRLTDFRATYQFDNRSFLRFSLQHSNTERNPLLYEDEVDATNKAVATQLLYSYKVNAQSRFYVGYSDAGFRDDNLEEMERSKRTIFVKASYAWQR
ncbi:MAG: DUF5916 domain-containing protein [Cellvibrionaceae bacterium]